MRQFVKRAYNKVVKGIARVEVGGAIYLKLRKLHLVFLGLTRLLERGFLRLWLCSLYGVADFPNLVVQAFNCMKDNLVVLVFQPFFREVVWNRNKKSPFFFGENEGVFEPGCKVGWGDFELELGQGSLPEFVFSHEILVRFIKLGMPVRAMIQHHYTRWQGEEQS